MLDNRTPDPVLQALASLRNDARFLVVLDYLKDYAEQSTIRLFNADSAPQIHRLQGSLLLIKSFLEKAKQANDTLKTRNANS